MQLLEVSYHEDQDDEDKKESICTRRDTMFENIEGNGIEKYRMQLNELEHKFDIYKQDLNNIIDTTISVIDHTIITKDRIANFMPYYYERMGNKLKGKILQEPIVSDYCMQYHYDSENRIIMIQDK